MANLEWDVPHTLQSVFGTVDLNVPDDFGRVYRIVPDTYQIIPSLRVTQDNISQADGSVLHPRWKSGMTAIIQVGLHVMVGDNEFEPACAQNLREMGNLLVLHLNAIRKLQSDDQRLFWTPTAYGDQQLLADIELLQIWTPTYDLDGVETLIAFAVESPFPYAIDATEIDTDIANGDTETIVNAGNSEQSPVVKVFGPVSAFTVTNEDDLDQDGNPLSIVYDASLPGAVSIGSGHYAEIDFFRGTIFLDGDGSDLIAGVNATLSDFWHLIPGGNDISITGTDCTVLSNNAWA